MTAIEISDPGALTTVQDLGRPGHAHLGVPRSGALDQPALRLANRLVGNEEGLAGLETTLTGIRFRTRGATRLAVSGATCDVRVDGRAMPWGTPISVTDGSLVELGPVITGLRSYLAFAGGVDADPVLGSRSTDLLSGLGPTPLAVGDVLSLGTSYGDPVAAEAVPHPAAPVLRLDLGPRADWFTEAALASLDGSSYTVGAASNRIGLRLIGAALARNRDTELPTEPMVLGALQVPPSGQPVVFLHDHPTTGGYPVIGVVRSADLPVCAQARPGDLLTLRVVAPRRAEQGRQPRS
ncbi:MAG: kipA [Marmoricola sp.]|nr:kipA [Marmoricola sp.]